MGTIGDCFKLMSGHAHRSLEGRVQHLAQRGVGVDHHRKLSDRRPGGDCVGALLNQVGGMYSDDVDAEDLLGVLVEENLRIKRLRMKYQKARLTNLGNPVALKLSQRFRIGLEVADRLPQGESLGLRLLLRLLLVQSHEGDLRVGEARSRNRIVVYSVRAADDVLDGGYALSGGCMRQHELAVGIADAIDVRNDLATLFLRQNPHSLVDGDVSHAVGFYPGLVKTHIRGVRYAASGYETSIDL